MKPLRIFFSFFWLLNISCKKEVPVAGLVPPAPAPVISYTYTSEKVQHLNVVYFVPNDVAIPTDYHRRVSELLLNAQEFFGNEMQRNGYGLKTSDHNLIIIPAYEYDANGEPGGPPFYGVGKSCFVLDYADQDVKYLGAGGTLGTRATKWIGGMIHELGHGLNLPHNRQKALSEASLGMSLMWAGNGTWGKSPTFLTKADSAALNTNQDLGSIKTANGLSMTQRSGLSRSVKDAKLLISNDRISFTSVGNYLLSNMLILNGNVTLSAMEIYSPGSD